MSRRIRAAWLAVALLAAAVVPLRIAEIYGAHASAMLEKLAGQPVVR
ncbi:hypothetical protein [Stenotrophomonas maltophilia]|nr:hypothetical protein [Stenotrophomonas maltophilia]